MSAEQNKSIVRRWVEEGWNQQNAALIDELFTPDFYQHETGPETVTNREALVGRPEGHDEKASRDGDDEAALHVGDGVDRLLEIEALRRPRH